MKKYSNVSSYIAGAPRKVQDKLKQLRNIINKIAPKAEEKISYGMPYYGYKGRLAFFAHARKHIGLYIMPYVIANHTEEVKKYRTGKATLRFELDKPLPITLIKRLIKAGIKKNEEKENHGNNKGR